MLKKSILTISVISIFASTTAVAFVANTDEGFSFGNSLVDAVDQNNIEIVKAALIQGNNPNQPGKFETTALHRAALNGNIEIANLLIQNGADVNIRDYGGASPLSIAAREGQEFLVKNLVSKGADIDSIDDQGYSPLHRAISNRQISVSKFLIQSGANVNTINNEGNSPLIDAVRTSSPEIVKQLLIKGADRQVVNNNGQDVIAFALRTKNAAIDNLLSKSQQDLMRENIVSSVAVTNTANSVPLFLRQESKMQIASTAGYNNISDNMVGVNAIKVPTAQVIEEELSAPNDINSIAAQPIMAQNESVKPFEISDLQLTGRNSANNSLVKAPRLSSNGSLPANIKNEINKEKEQAEQKQLAEMQKAYQQGLQNFKPIDLPQNIETNSNTIQLANNSTQMSDVVYNFEYKPSAPKEASTPPSTAKKSVASTEPSYGNNSRLPASMKKNNAVVAQQVFTQQPIVQNNFGAAETMPVTGLQIISKDGVEQPQQQNVIPAAPAQNPSYENEVDALMNSVVAEPAVDNSYENEVNNLLNSYLVDAPAPVVTNSYQAPANNNIAVKNNFTPPSYPKSLALRNTPNNTYTQQTTYNNEIDQILNQQIKTTNYTAKAITAAPVAVNYSTVAASQNPVIAQNYTAPITSTKTALSDYHTYKNDLLNSINDFYNKDLGQVYKPYDISELSRQRAANLGFRTAQEEKAAAEALKAAPADYSAESSKLSTKSIFSEDANSSETSTDLELPSVAGVESVKSEDLETLPAEELPAIEEPSVDVKKSLEVNFSDSGENLYNAVIGDFASSAEAVEYLNKKASEFSNKIEYKVAKDEISNMYSVAINSVSSEAEAQKLCDALTESDKTCKAIKK